MVTMSEGDTIQIEIVRISFFFINQHIKNTKKYSKNEKPTDMDY